MMVQAVIILRIDVFIYGEQVLSDYQVRVVGRRPTSIGIDNIGHDGVAYVVRETPTWQ
jgi:hypothetical protein